MVDPQDEVADNPQDLIDAEDDGMPSEMDLPTGDVSDADEGRDDVDADEPNMLCDSTCQALQDCARGDLTGRCVQVCEAGGGGTGCGEDVGCSGLAGCIGECPYYCLAYLTACPSVDIDWAECHSRCGEFARSHDTESRRDDYECRVRHALAAVTDGTGSCGAAAPDSTSCSDTTCDLYCDGLEESCPAEFAVLGTHESCLRTCGSYEIRGGEPVSNGDSLGCRQTHLALAAEDPARHCSAAGPTGGESCVDPDLCEDHNPLCHNDEACNPETGECELLQCQADAFEPNDAYEAASRVAPDSMNDGLLCPGEADWFTSDLPDGGPVWIDVAFDRARGPLEIRAYPNEPFDNRASIRRRNAEGMQIVFPPAGEDGPRQIWTEIQGLLGPYSNEFTISVRPNPLVDCEAQPDCPPAFTCLNGSCTWDPVCGDPNEPSDMFEMPQVPLGEWVEAAICQITPRESDYYRVVVPERGHLRVHMESEPTPAGSLSLNLRAEDRTILDRTGSPHDTKFIAVPNLEPGEYQLFVGSRGNTDLESSRVIPYRMRVDLLPLEDSPPCNADNPCIGDGTCSGRRVCLDNLECEIDIDCDESDLPYCNGGTCTACITDEHCPAGEACETGDCVCPPDELEPNTVGEPTRIDELIGDEIPLRICGLNGDSDHFQFFSPANRRLRVDVFSLVTGAPEAPTVGVYDEDQNRIVRDNDNIHDSRFIFTTSASGLVSVTVQHSVPHTTPYILRVQQVE